MHRTDTSYTTYAHIVQASGALAAMMSTRATLSRLSLFSYIPNAELNFSPLYRAQVYLPALLSRWWNNAKRTGAARRCSDVGHGASVGGHDVHSRADIHLSLFPNMRRLLSGVSPRSPESLVQAPARAVTC